MRKVGIVTFSKCGSFPWARFTTFEAPDPNMQLPTHAGARADSRARSPTFPEDTAQRLEVKRWLQRGARGPWLGGAECPQRQVPQRILFCRGECLCGPHVALLTVTIYAPVLPVSETQEIPLGLSGSITQLCAVPYRSAVCPLASSLCLPTWLAFSSGNKGGVQFWAVPGSSYPPPLPSSLRERCPPVSGKTPWF